MNHSNPKKIKSLNMRYFCLQEQIKLHNLKTECQPVIDNLEDYFTKYNPSIHRQKINKT